MVMILILLLGQGFQFVICDQCEWNGVPNQNVVLVYLGISPANEPGFIYKYETYDYSEYGIGRVHRHKYDPGLIDHIIDQFDRNKRLEK